MAPDVTEDLRGRLVQVEHRVTEFAPRIAALEVAKAQKDVSDAETKIILTNLVNGVDAIKGGISKILWAIGLAVLIAIVTWMLSGGLSSARNEVSKANIFGYPETAITKLEKETTCPSEKPVYVASYCRRYPDFSK